MINREKVGEKEALLSPQEFLLLLSSILPHQQPRHSANKQKEDE
jgi:hypothetical protein